MARSYKKYPPTTSPTRLLVQKVMRFVGQAAIWVVVAVAFHFLFALVIDTPAEHRAKQTNRLLRKEYNTLVRRLDTLDMVLDNVIERDKNVFRILFESEPYQFDERYENRRLKSFDRLAAMSDDELFAAMQASKATLEQNMSRYYSSGEQLEEKMLESGVRLNNIPAIQPIVNNELTLLTASYGMRIHPFYKTLNSHQGVDYTVAEGSRVFATADGTVKDVSRRNTTSGLTVVLSHGEGYETVYSHLGKTDLKRGQSVKRGDIIATTGNSGLSLSPHLHYEVLLNGMRVDPVHYFFMELSPADYARMIKISQSGMQSFD